MNFLIDSTSPQSTFGHRSGIKANPDRRVAAGILV